MKHKIGDSSRQLKIASKRVIESFASLSNNIANQSLDVMRKKAEYYKEYQKESDLFKVGLPD